MKAERKLNGPHPGEPVNVREVRMAYLRYFEKMGSRITPLAMDRVPAPLTHDPIMPTNGAPGWVYWADFLFPCVKNYKVFETPGISLGDG